MRLDRLARKRRNTNHGNTTSRLHVEALEARRVLTAMVQVIHNSSFVEAETVDLYADGELLIDDFAFRTASPFIEAESGVDIQVDITFSDAVDNSNPFFSGTVNLADGSTNVVVAFGDPLYRQPNQPFGLAITDEARTSASDPEQVDILAFHGVRHLGPVDIVAVNPISGGEAGLIDDLAYGTYSDYLSLNPAPTSIEVTNAIDHSTVLAAGQMDLRSMTGQSVVLILSGSYAPADGEQGLGILAVNPDGSTSLLPSADEPSSIQLINNSPYAGAATLDVYVEGVLVVDDLAFREATPFMQVPANLDLKVDVTPGDAADNSAPIYSTTINFGDASYIAVAVGDPAGGDGQPAFDLAVTANGQEAASDPTQIEVMKFNGSPDSGPIDIYARDLAQVADDLAFGQFTDTYGAGPPDIYTVDTAPADDNSITIGSFEADYTAGGALLLLASGYVNPPTEADAAFGLLVVAPDGTATLLPELATRIAGDANGDGVFDDNDLIQVLAAGKYGTGEPASWAEGDWNRDGVFNCYDIIDAMKQGNYMGDNSVSPAAPAAVESIFGGDE